jgi:hypothetical protein
MPVETITIGPGRLTIGAEADLTNFSSQITKALIKPDVKKGDSINVLSGETVSGDRSESFTLDGTMLQDLNAGLNESKAIWLFEHRGEDHPFVYVPANAAAVQISGTLTVEAVDLGGEVKTKPTSDFSFELVGAPVIAAMAAARGAGDIGL